MSIDDFNKLAAGFNQGNISTERIEILDRLADYISANPGGNLNFICTHNSRRSQISQILATVISSSLDVSINCFSGGTEVTAFHPNAVNALRRCGLTIESDEAKNNPRYSVIIEGKEQPLVCFSKLYDDPSNPKSGFAAVMTCSDADANCPIIPGADQRIPLNYEDPKEFDNTPRESEAYFERCAQIVGEMIYVFTKVKNGL